MKSTRPRDALRRCSCYVSVLVTKKSTAGNTDPRDAFEQVREQVCETLNKGFSDALSMIQEVGATVEQRLEEVFGVKAEKAPAKKPPAKKPPAKKPPAKKAPAKRTSATPTRDDLYAEAQRLDIAGRSKMSKAQLQRAIKATKR